MVFDLCSIIAFYRVNTILPASTVILNGTPHGVGMAAKPQPRWLKPGVRVDIVIESIGILSNTLALEPIA
jgi:2-keto-4-pentenoate hydratase/2-oxohepta-3-ene-1,7-dioic acid hydratase in catechol pathway